MKEALLCVSFGTSVEEARGSITAVENAMRQAVPDALFLRAFTSPTIRRILAKRGESIPSVEEAMTRLLELGVERVVVQPTHMLYGHEYDKLERDLAPFGERFPSIKLGVPLLADTSDIQTLAHILDRAYPREAETAQVLFGHGTDHFANAVYPAMQTAFHLLGRADMLVGTVEGWPSYEDAAAQLAGMQVKRVHLSPMMLVAGDHARNDMDGGCDSWRTRLEAAGYAVHSTIRGLGLLPEVQELYCRHLKEIW